MANRNTQEFPSPEEDPRFHDTYQFLRRYRDATYSLKVVVHQMEHQFKLQYDNDIDKFLDSIYAAGADLTGSDIEQRAKKYCQKQPDAEAFGIIHRSPPEQSQAWGTVLLDSLLRFSLSTGNEKYR